MRQSRRGMAQGHRSHVSGMRCHRTMEHDYGHHHGDLIGACAGARIRFAAIGRRMLALGWGMGTLQMRRLTVVVARHGSLDVRH